MNKTFLAAVSAAAILAGSGVALAAQHGAETGQQIQPQTGAQTGAQTGMEQRWGAGQDIRATVESIDEDTGEVTLRFRAGMDAQLQDLQEGDEVRVSFEEDELRQFRPYDPDEELGVEQDFETDPADPAAPAD